MSDLRTTAGSESVADRVELVTLVDDAGRSLGTSPKAEVHHAATPLHLAFSCYVFDPESRLLVTQRAYEKHTWPGVWTNTVCGHPAPGEGAEDAVVRRAADELGLALHDLRLVLPRFRYRAVMPNGVVENELCPVFTAVTTADPRPNGAEVAAVDWAPWSLFTADVLSGRRTVSPWCVSQLEGLLPLGPDPLAWPAHERAELPAAARP